VITGGAGNDTVIAQAGTGEDDNVNTGGGNDIVSFTITAFADRDQAGNTGTYDFAGGTADVVSFSDAGTIADADFARLTNVESVQLANGTNSLTVGTAAAAAGILVLNGGTGVDTITSGAAANTIIGGAGADVLVGGGGADTYVFAATGALNGNDVFAANIVGGAGGDILDFRAMGTFTLLSATATEHDGTANTAIANKVVLLASADGGVVAVDSAAEVAALIDGAGDAMELVSGGKAIIIAGDNSAATAGALIYLVDDTLGAVAGTISADDIVIIGNATLDIDTVLAANLLLA
jgi:Ca2+-binding RTX toxin-like protein